MTHMSSKSAHLYSSSMSASCSVLDSRLNDPSEESSVAPVAAADKWLLRRCCCSRFGCDGNSTRLLLPRR